MHSQDYLPLTYKNDILMGGGMKKLLVLGLFTSVVFAAETPLEPFSSSLEFAQVINVNAIQSKDDSWCFNTKVRHNDQGWQHYVDAWKITDLKGNVLAIRELAHPHDNEQPFTRSLCNIKLPKALIQVVVSAQCNVHGVGSQNVMVDLSNLKGKGFSVTRLD